jgi:uncharacterized protein YdhG (YjbR/CyaY superfamily)
MRESVIDYINKQKSPQKEICHKLRSIIQSTFPDIKEEMKLGVPWYQGKYYIVALKDHVNLGFSISGLSKEEIKQFKGSGKTMKNVEIRSIAEIEEQKIVRLLRIVK